ncbi:MAG: 5-formyltetrahydrofolate cyclo-ligase, partial [Oscillospiraceae bacterium]|nr:5-formyltetrahydrofolate cyclo-ligase [Oscillospiraceae bacterium]
MMHSIQEEKKLLRTQVRQIITRQFLPLREEISRGICNHVLADTLYEKAKTVFLFVGTEREVDTLPILENAWRTGKTVCVPRCIEGNQMALCRITSMNDLQSRAYGILEPAENCPTLPHSAIDFALIPCLACTRKGDRLGKGGGYYDRFFERYNGPA